MNPFRCILAGAFLAPGILSAQGGGFLAAPVADIGPGRASAFDQPLEEKGVTVGDDYYFVAAEPNNSIRPQIWKHNPADGAKKIQEFTTASYSTRPNALTWSEPFIYFEAFEDTTGRELWRIDTRDGRARIVADIVFGPNGTRADDLAPIPGGGIVYTAPLADPRDELWLGRPAGGAVLLKNLRTDPAGSRPFGMIPAGGKVFFAAAADNVGYELHLTDGTTAGTRLVKEITPGSGWFETDLPRTIASIGDRVFFSAFVEPTGRELYISDGTTAGTFLLADIYPGPNSSLPNTIDPLFAVIGDRLLVGVRTNMGEAVWVSDGTTAGTRVVTQFPRDTNLVDVAANARAGFFSTNDSELYITDGTTAGTRLVFESGTARLENLEVVNDYLFFTRTNAAGDLILMVSDGTTAGTVELNIAAGAYSGRSPSDLTASADRLYFTALTDRDTDFAGRELWFLNVPPLGSTPVVEFLVGRFPFAAGMDLNADRRIDAADAVQRALRFR